MLKKKRGRSLQQVVAVSCLELWLKLAPRSNHTNQKTLELLVCVYILGGLE